MTYSETMEKAQGLRKRAKTIRRDAAYADHGAYGQDLADASRLEQEAARLERMAHDGYEKEGLARSST